ncbi:MAG: hypothetical protein ACM31D_04610 [Bacteroidota bacterium]
MSEYLTRNQQVSAKIQADAEVAVTPDPVADGLRVRQSVKVNTTAQAISTDEARGGLDQSPSLVGATNREIPLAFYLRGSGAAGTPPEYDVPLRIAGMSAMIIAAPVTGNAQAGAVGSITLAAGASGVTDAYKGTVITIDSGTGLGQVRVITGYNATTKVATVTPDFDPAPDATSVYTIAPGVLYRTISTGLEAATIYRWQHRTDGTGSRLKKLWNCTADLSLTIQNGQPLEATVTAKGIFSEAMPHEDVTKPSAKTFATLTPPILKGAKIFLGGKKLKLNQLSFQLGTDPQMVPDPTSDCGYSGSQITNRAAKGNLDAALTLKSTRDAMADWLTGAVKPLWIATPGAAGNRVSLFWPEINYTGNQEQDVGQFAGEGAPFESAQLDGALYIWVY